MIVLKEAQVPEDNPSARQNAAADPLRSVWVGASAGTGKTKVLIDRLLRLMLPRAGMPMNSATRPEKILCLTFTKTAAAEMSNRIYKRLGEWAVKDDAALVKDIGDLIGEDPSADILRAARRLFARVLDTPGGLRIMTLHSFCQSVLKRFPVEAGLPPHFELMDEQSAVEYLTRCLHDIIADTRRNPSGKVAAAFDHLAQHLDSEGMSDLMSKIMAKRNMLLAILSRHGDAEGDAAKTIDAVYACLGVSRHETERDILREAGNIGVEHTAALKRAMSALFDGKSSEDVGKAKTMADWLSHPELRSVMFYDYADVFLTKGELRKRLATKKAIDVYPDILEVMTREGERVQEISRRLSSVRLAEVNASLLTISAQMVGRYAAYKKSTDRLDFDDLIIRTCDLLSGKDMLEWVLYKLDEGIDHILVDEAQDTSPLQWKVVKALTYDFFDGQGSREGALRTLFVVGDEKQSIFSFQGADPSEFDRSRDFFGNKVHYIQKGWEVLLEHSFRSTKTVLQLVDDVFSVDASRQGVVADINREVRHLPFRTGHAGLVEIWPLMKGLAKKESDPWKIPVEVEDGDSAGARLAERIADTIRHWRESGEVLASKGRPIRAGDVLILVQTRGVLVEQIMRALKEKDVPVAGIDRLTLSEEIAVMDLLAFASFALSPRDDLTLATLLKSPLLGVNEEELFLLCHNRNKATLWERVIKMRPDIVAYLKPFTARAGKITPYEFFADILNMPCVADKISGRRAFYGRLGYDIHDALDEFLNRCLHYEQTHTPALQKFVAWFMQGESEIKREQEQHNTDQVRIMTVHASKGLQAPIVFLPDTAKIIHDHNKGRARLLWPSETGDDAMTVPLWSPRADFDAPFYAARQRAAVERQEEEYRRLLYVALTRAEDRLYIAGFYNSKKPRAECWYNLVDQAFPANADKEFFMTDEAGEDLFLRRLSHPQEVKPKEEKRETEKTFLYQELPAWAKVPPKAEQSPSKPLAPSKPGEDEPAVRSPIEKDDGWKFRRGIIVHGLLEVLPELPIEKRAAALRRYLARPDFDMDAAAQETFACEVLAVLDHPEFAPIFGRGSRAEVPVVGLAASGGRVISGQIDRLLVTDDAVLIVDYKTNRPPPSRAEDVAPIYLKQMAAYRHILHNVYPDRTIKCALLWTDGPNLMPLSEKLLDSHAP